VTQIADYAVMEVTRGNGFDIPAAEVCLKANPLGKIAATGSLLRGFRVAFPFRSRILR
jgi:hypothetical protein